jgi:zinc protease
MLIKKENMKNIILAIGILIAGTSVLAQTGKSSGTKKQEPLQIDRSKAPQPAEAEPINIGTPTSFVLDNGLKVFVVQNNKLPKVSFQLSVDVPIFLEGDKVGLSQLAGEMLGAGTTKKTKAQIDEEIDFIGADLTTTANGIFASCLSKHSETVLAMMSEIMLNPAFPQEELDKKKKRLHSNLKSIASNADAIAGRVESVLMYGTNHPYGEVQMASHIDNITIEDCKKYYADNFRPNISYLVIVGDIQPEKAKEMVVKYFGSWEKKDVPSKDFGHAQPVSGVRVAFVNKPGAVQSVIKVIYPVDYKIGSDDAASVSIMSGIFGGAFSSRLNMNLRENKAYTYGASGSVGADRYIGRFKAGASVRNDVTDSAVTEILFEMNQMIKADVSEDELSRNKNYNMGNFALSLERDQTLAGFALNIEKYGLPKDYYQNYLSRMQQVTVADVRKAAQRYIKPNNCIILVVGNEQVADKLKKFDSDGEIEFYDINGKLREKERKALPEGLTAQQVVTNHILAVTQTKTMKEATKKLKGIKDMSAVYEGEIQGQKLTMENKKMAPNLFKVEMKAMGMTIQKVVCDGKKVVSNGMQGKEEYTGEKLEEMKAGGSMVKEMNYLNGEYTLTLIGFDEMGGKEVYHVEVKNKGGKIENEYYLVENGLKVHSSSTNDTPQGAMEVTSEFTDYKNVGGLLIAHRMSQSFGPQSLDFVAKEIKVNAGLKSADFKITD